MGLLSNRIGRGSLKAGDHIYSWRTAYVYAHHGIYVGDNKVIHFTRGGRGEEVGTGTVLDYILVSSGPARSQVPCTICNRQEEGNGVVSSCLDCFLAGGVLYRFEYAVSPALFLAKARGGTCTLAGMDPDEVVVHRATYLLTNGFGCYNVFKNNCEDFAIYCKTGLLVIGEGQSGNTVSIITEPLTTVLRALSSLPLGQSGQAISIIGGPISAVASTSLRIVTTNVYGIAATAVGVYSVGRYLGDIGMRKDVMKVEAEDLTARLASGRFQVAASTTNVPACGTELVAGR